MIAPMPLDVADRIYAEVLTGAYRRSVGAEGRGAKHQDEDLTLGPAAVRMCRCEWGPCGHCQASRPDRCAHRRGTSPKTWHETWILNRDGMAVAEVRLTGRPCQWRCPGPPGGDLLFAVQADAVVPPRTRAERPAAKRPAVEQPNLFALAGGAA
ncbi:DUF6248 family natural product biosynthesis protein [Actinoplanes sp. NPDC051851]|uniref:DUF6248 family natural product biosynthesis protein n=1 Tax=Actinoplanes sp. NPDC051851 TaxID=3154753 RepID=UPI003437B8EF